MKESAISILSGLLFIFIHIFFISDFNSISSSGLILRLGVQFHRGSVQIRVWVSISLSVYDPVPVSVLILQFRTLEWSLL